MESGDAAGYSISPCGNCVLCNSNGLCSIMEFKTNISDVNIVIRFNSTCRTTNYIYLLYCNHPGCNMKYVGKSTTPIRKRMYGHRNNLTAGKEPHLLQWHFTKIHQPSNMVIKPIELITGTMNINNRENFWMKEINTVFPYGLNDRTDVKGIFDAYDFVVSNRSKIPIYSVFNKVVVTRGTRGRGRGRYRDNILFKPDEFICSIMEYNGNNPFKKTRNDIMALTKQHTKELFLFAITHLEDTKYVPIFNEYFMYLIKDICLFKLQRYYKQKPKNNNFLVIQFDNKLIENINIARIMESEGVKQLFPHHSDDMSTPNVTYSYSKTIRSQIVNYRQTIKDIGNINHVCKCHDYPDKFMNNEYGHIYTGDLDIINNANLKNILQKGLNYRDQQAPCKDTALRCVTSAIDKYIAKTNGKINKPIREFSAWRSEILKIVKDKLDSMQLYKYYSILKDTEVNNELQKLKDDFVLTPIDKAANNISLVCKKFYLDTLDEEIEKSGNFAKCNINTDDILNTHRQDYEKFGIHVPGDIWKLPFLYWTSKMHKTPPKFRYITSGIKSSMSILSDHVGKCLKSLLKSAKQKSRYSNKYTSYNDYFIIDDRKEVIDMMENMNTNRKKGGRKQVNTYDFSTLYTSIPHTKLKCKMREFVNDVFKHSGKTFVNSSKNNAYQSKKRSERADASFSKEELIEAVEIVIDNSYTIYKNLIYRQVVGIPMGTNCAPHLANIFLFMFEQTYINNLVNSKQIKKAALLRNIYRYQDDAIVFNDNGFFNLVFKDIYPEELVLLNTNTSRNECNFLDLSIVLQNGKFKYSIFDKRKDFNFEVIHYPFLSGNIPRIPSYGVYISQLIRFCNICSESMTDMIIQLNKKFIKQGFKIDSLKRKFNLFASKYIHLWSKFGIDITSPDYLNSIF